MMTVDTANQRLYEIKGNHCGGCKAKIEAHLSEIPEIETAEMDLATKRLTVHGKADPRVVLFTLSNIGFDATLII